MTSQTVMIDVVKEPFKEKEDQTNQIEAFQTVGKSVVSGVARPYH